MQSLVKTVDEPAKAPRLAGRMQADFATSFGRVMAYSQSWSEPIDTISVSDHHWLQLSLMPSTHTERGRYPDHWQPHHFEPIGDLFLLPAGQCVHAKSECRNQIALACAFDPLATQAWLGEDLEWTAARLKGSLHLANPVIRGLLLRLGEEIRAPGLGSETLVELISGQIVIEVGRHFRLITGGASGGLAPWRLRLVDERLAADCESPSLTELADLVGLSVRQLERGFRASRGHSVGSYIALKRIEHAKQLLLTNPSIKAVAYALGYGSASNFTSAFRRSTGLTPRAFRQRAGRLSDFEPASKARN